MLQRPEFRPRNADSLSQAGPGFDAAGVGLVAIMVADALDPEAASVAIGAVGEDVGVLHRDLDLVVEPVRHPALDLFAGQLARGHFEVIGVVDVVVDFLGAQLRLEFLTAPGGKFAHGWGLTG